MLFRSVVASLHTARNFTMPTTNAASSITHHNFQRDYPSEEIYETRNHSRRAAGDLSRKIQGPASTVTKHGDTIYVSGSPPFDPKTGEIFKGPIERQTEIVLDQLKLCVETAGSSLLRTAGLILKWIVSPPFYKTVL